jgi:hypothetical protein
MVMLRKNKGPACVSYEVWLPVLEKEDALEVMDRLLSVPTPGDWNIWVGEGEREDGRESA